MFKMGKYEDLLYSSILYSSVLSFLKGCDPYIFTQQFNVISIFLKKPIFIIYWRFEKYKYKT